jgi:hypothetical protein
VFEVDIAGVGADFVEAGIEAEVSQLAGLLRMMRQQKARG